MGLRNQSSYPYLIYHLISLAGLARATQTIQLPRGKNYLFEKIIASWPETGGPPTNFSTPRIQIENFNTAWVKSHETPPPLNLLSTPGVGGRSAQYLNAKSYNYPIMFKGVFSIIITEINPLVAADFLDLLIVGRAITSE